jgi:siroheme synthase (precorrin-2 oxidase/ferrochelatase)
MWLWGDNKIKCNYRDILVNAISKAEAITDFRVPTWMKSPEKKLPGYFQP